jgi:hypothetical protein
MTKKSNTKKRTPQYKHLFEMSSSEKIRKAMFYDKNCSFSIIFAEKYNDMAKKLVRFDWAMKKMLRHKANFDILEGFLSELLDEEIKIKQILDSESNKETADDKFNRVDILVENSKGTRYH